MDENENPFALFNREDTAEQAQAGGGSLLVGAPEDPERHAYQVASGPPGAHHPGVDGAWNFGKPAAASRLPRVRMPVALALVVLLVAGVGSYLFMSRRSSSGGTAFALSLSRDKTYGYRIHVDMQGTMSVQGQQAPFNMKMDESISWRVESVDPDGTATVAVTVQDVSGQVNGQPVPSIPQQTSRIRVAKDGRMLSIGNLTLTSGTDFGSIVPGSDQFMPLLPDRPVDVGDSWTKKFDQELPFGMGRLRYQVESSLLRYQVVDGNRMALIFSTMSLPLDMSIDLKKVLAASGASAGQSFPGNPKMQFGGSMRMQQTAWFDQARGELYRTSGTATFDMAIEFKDFPQAANPPSGQLHFAGKMNLDVQRLDSKPKPTKEELAAQDRKAQSDLRNALAAAKVLFTDANTYGGFTPASAEKIEPSLSYNTSGKANRGQVSIRVATRNAILLVTRTAGGNVFCIADRVGRKIAYGARDARTVAGCRGGW